MNGKYFTFYGTVKISDVFLSLYFPKILNPSRVLYLKTAKWQWPWDSVGILLLLLICMWKILICLHCLITVLKKVRITKVNFHPKVELNLWVEWGKVSSRIILVPGYMYWIQVLANIFLNSEWGSVNGLCLIEKREYSMVSEKDMTTQ